MTGSSHSRSAPWRSRRESRWRVGSATTAECCFAREAAANEHRTVTPAFHATQPCRYSSEAAAAHIGSAGRGAHADGARSTSSGGDALSIPRPSGPDQHVHAVAARRPKALALDAAVQDRVDGPTPGNDPPSCPKRPKAGEAEAAFAREPEASSKREVRPARARALIDLPAADELVPIFAVSIGDGLGRAEDECLDRHVGVEVGVAHDRDYPALGKRLDRGHQVCAHGLLELLA